MIRHWGGPRAALFLATSEGAPPGYCRRPQAVPWSSALPDSDSHSRRGQRLIQLEWRSSGPLHLQLYKGLRSHIARGLLAAGARLPSSRVLAQDLGVSRNTVVAALDQLIADGWVESRRGSGVYVTRPPTPVAVTPVHKRGTDEEPETLPFDVGAPGLDLFPLEAWRRIQTRRWSTLGRSALRQGRSAGFSGLRQTIADHLTLTRSAPCAPEQIFVTQSARSGLGLAVRALCRPGDRVWVEDPAYEGSKVLMRGQGLSVHPVPVDDRGFDVARAVAEAPDARLALVTPQCQFPTGAILAPDRRKALLDWAEVSGRWIVEDDYDAEYRFDGPAIAPLFAQSGRVVYVHSYNKTLFPALRIGFLVTPPDLVDRFEAVRREFDDHPNVPAQMVLRDFIEEGWLDSHLRNTRAAYAERRRAMIDRVTPLLAPWLDFDFLGSGLHLMATPRKGLTPEAICLTARAAGVEVTSALSLSESPLQERRLLFGFAGYSPSRLVRAGLRLRDALQARSPESK